MKTTLKKTLNRLGLDIIRHKNIPDDLPPDLTEDERAVYAKVRQFTMTGPERVVALINAARYISDNQIAPNGAVVECGVWRGGSMMAVAEVLHSLGDTRRKLYLCDTFEGMTEPSVKDRQFDGRTATDILAADEKNTGMWCYADESDVRANMAKTGYPEDKLVFVKGKVEETIPASIREEIALLRLDTDWYGSTKHELEHLYPRLVPGGVMIIDDYGHWRGSREATDEYFAAMHGPRPLFNRIDYTGRLLIKPA